MNVVISIDATGPDPVYHEVIQFGAVITDDLFGEEIARFAVYIRPQNPERAELAYLRMAGIRSIEQLESRMQHWEPADKVWESFLRLLIRHSGNPGMRPAKALRAYRFCSFNAVVDIPFLVHNLRTRYGIKTPDITKSVSSLCSNLMAYQTTLLYIGLSRDVPLDFLGVLDRLGVTCRNVRDATARASAIRECYKRFFDKQKKVYERAIQAAKRPKAKPKAYAKGPIIRRKA
jgi:hypothetical protein